MYVFYFKQKTAYEIGLGIPAEPLFRSSVVSLCAFKKVISRRNIRRRITIPLTLSNLKLLRRITRTENILHRNFTRRQVAIQNRVASNIGISQSTFSRSEERRVGKERRTRWSPDR